MDIGLTIILIILVTLVLLFVGKKLIEKDDRQFTECFTNEEYEKNTLNGLRTSRLFFCIMGIVSMVASVVLGYSNNNNTTNNIFPIMFALGAVFIAVSLYADNKIKLIHLARHLKQNTK